MCESARLLTKGLPVVKGREKYKGREYDGIAFETNCGGLIDHGFPGAP